MNPRWVASQHLMSVIYQGRSLTEAIQDIDRLNTPDAALIKDICFGSIRWHYRLSAVLDELLVKPLKKRDKDVECVIRVGLYQLIYQKTPSHAAVNETVTASKALKKKWTKGLINGVLRSFQRKRQVIEETLQNNPIAQYSHPEWMVKHLQQSWPDDWQNLLQAGNERAPMTLRVNLAQHSRDEYLQLLEQSDIQAKSHSAVKSAIILDKPVAVSQLPGFDKGACSVQDASAQLSGYLLACEPGMRVLDACSAPGGKTGHLLERNESIVLHAIDNHPERLKRVQQNLDRLGKEAKLIEADAGNIDVWFDGNEYDRILLDAPCSATGVIRRHPDIKLLRKASDIGQVQATQKQLLSKLWGILKPGGQLLYATCSIFPEENETQLAAFVAMHDDAIVMPIEADWGRPQEYGRQVLTQPHMDGFYYALIEKRSQTSNTHSVTQRHN